MNVQRDKYFTLCRQMIKWRRYRAGGNTNIAPEMLAKILCRLSATGLHEFHFLLFVPVVFQSCWWLDYNLCTLSYWYLRKSPVAYEKHRRASPEQQDRQTPHRQTSTSTPSGKDAKVLTTWISTTDTSTKALHHKKCHEKNTELYYYHFKYIVIVPGSALTYNDHSALGFKMRSEGACLTCSSPSCLAVCLLPVC